MISTSLITGFLGESSPAAGAKLGDASEQLCILLRCPWPPLHRLLLAARSSAHIQMLIFYMISTYDLFTARFGAVNGGSLVGECIAAALWIWLIN
jgi:hypothetical protein